MQIKLYSLGDNFPECQNSSEEIYISGLKLKRGKLNSSLLYLEEENTREFSFCLNNFAAIPEKKKSIDGKTVNLKIKINLIILKIIF